MGERWIEHTVSEEEAGQTVQEILTGALRISRRRIQKLTRSRGIRLNRRAAFLARAVRPGDVVAARAADDEAIGLEPVAMPLTIVYEDAQLLVLDKPPFVLVHPTSPAQRSTLSHGIAHHFLQQRLRAKVRPVHRLDRDTSGLLLVAKTPVAHHRLDRQLRDREMRREYLGLVAGVMAQDQGVIDAPIGRHPHDPNLRAVRPHGEPARTRFWVEERYPAATRVRLELETGRTHQIRVHLAHLGHPVLGDIRYGGPAVPALRRQALHASRLAFAHPTTGDAMACSAPPPADLERLIDELKTARPAILPQPD